MTAVTYTYRGQARARLVSTETAPILVRALRHAGAEHIRMEVVR